VRAELNATAASVTLPEAPAYVIAAPDGALPPYYVIEPIAPSDDAVDRPLGPADPALVIEVRVKAVGGSVDTAANLRRLAMVKLSPDSVPTPLAGVPGRHVEVSHARFEAAYADDSVTITNTNKHPILVVDAYVLDSQPTA
jgi:hypothetical protein